MCLFTMQMSIRLVLFLNFVEFNESISRIKFNHDKFYISQSALFEIEWYQWYILPGLQIIINVYVFKNRFCDILRLIFMRHHKTICSDKRTDSTGKKCTILDYQFINIYSRLIDLVLQEIFPHIFSNLHGSRIPFKYVTA